MRSMFYKKKNNVKKCLDKQCSQFLADHFESNEDVLTRRTRDSTNLGLPTMAIRFECTRRQSLTIVNILTVMCSVADGLEIILKKKCGSTEN